MPIYSFTCCNGHTSELRCKYDERGQQVCPECNALMAHDGHIEGGAKFKLEGAYRLKLVMNSGERVEVAHHKGRRSDH